MQKIPTILVVVAAALVDDEGRVLLQKRPEGKAMAGLWEFPGGKIEPGETAEFGLCRELAEELGITVEPTDLAPLAFTTGQVEGRALLLLLFSCRRWQGEPQPLESPQIEWVIMDAMTKLPMPPADKPLVDALRKWLEP